MALSAAPAPPSARTSLPFRVVGYVESTQATAGTWATAPSTIQGYGGQALAAMSSLGYGQTWQNVTASRVSATTYYNTTGKPIFISATSAASTQIVLVIAGATVQSIGAASGVNGLVAAPIPANASYVVTCTSIGSWLELR